MPILPALAGLAGVMALSGTVIVMTDRGLASRTAAGMAFIGYPACAVLAILAAVVP